MNELKNIGISFGITLICLLALTFFMTLLNYINIVSDSLVSVVQIMISVFSLFIGGFLLGKKSVKKGWLQGLKLGSLFLIILILFQYLALQMGFSIKNLVFYLLLMISTIFGSMLGINRKKETT